MSRKRPHPRTRCAPPAAINLTTLAPKTRYVGSVEHKDAPSPAGWPRPRADASICDRNVSSTFVQATRWLRSAIRKGDVGAPWEGEFPRYAWYKVGDVVYEGRLVNRNSGDYKGYPLEKAEWPVFMR